MDLFSSNSFRVLERGLDGAQIKQKAITQNIANVDTPNYKAKTVSFRHMLNDAMGENSFRAHRTDQRHLEFSTRKQGPIIESSNSTMYNHNQNNVDIDHEMAELAKNQIYYNALIERLNGRFSSIKNVIGGR
ncbi:flagellar basal body rod protein FlgB [Halalkalibacter urbisdiaboli]|uniref:flagellar basal body rod protein FlgB n=1 Tax=Halalkalibacter urbisdiaboli TaxID=1960589 RepID=UPI000B42F291|nr:flagellar basal body rod protein FlgB [Halalkalibacter urbisdiaboli]